MYAQSLRRGFNLKNRRFFWPGFKLALRASLKSRRKAKPSRNQNGYGFWAKPKIAVFDGPKGHQILPTVAKVRWPFRPSHFGNGFAEGKSQDLGGRRPPKSADCFQSELERWDVMRFTLFLSRYVLKARKGWWKWKKAKKADFL